MPTLILLGTGTCSVTAARSMSGYALVRDGRIVLLDCGPGTLRRMAEAGLSVHDVDAVLLSHLHVDHVADLAPLLFSRKYDPLGPGERPIALWGPVGVAHHLDTLVLLHGATLFYPDDPPAITEFAVGSTWHRGGVGNLAVTARRVDHGAHEALGYRIEGDGFALAYSGDSGPCDALVHLSQGADLFLCECSVPDDAEVPGHMTPRHVGEIAAQAECRKVVLTHLYPMMDAVDAEAGVRKYFGGEVVRGADGMRFALGRMAG